MYALEQHTNHAAGRLAPDIKAEIKKLVGCDLLILSFPIFWFSVPAIMKGWIDRVFISGLTYGGKRFYDRGDLRGRKALVVTMLGGRDHRFGPDALHGAIETMLSPLLRGTLAHIGFEVLPPLIAYHVPYVVDDQRISRRLSRPFAGGRAPGAA